MSQTGSGGLMKVDTVEVDIGEWATEAEIPEIDATKLNSLLYEAKSGIVRTPFTAEVRFDANSAAKLLTWTTGATPLRAPVTVELYLSATQKLSGSAIFTRIGTAVKRGELIVHAVAGTFTGQVTLTNP